MALYRLTRTFLVCMHTYPCLCLDMSVQWSICTASKAEPWAHYSGWWIVFCLGRRGGVRLRMFPLKQGVGLQDRASQSSKHFPRSLMMASNYANIIHHDTPAGKLIKHWANIWKALFWIACASVPVCVRESACLCMFSKQLLLFLLLCVRAYVHAHVCVSQRAARCCICVAIWSEAHVNLTRGSCTLSGCKWHYSFQLLLNPNMECYTKKGCKKFSQADDPLLTLISLKYGLSNKEVEQIKIKILPQAVFQPYLVIYSLLLNWSQFVSQEEFVKL